MWGGLTENLRSIVEADLFQGLTVLLLAGFALAAWRREVAQGRLILGYAALALCASLVALGPEVRLFGSTLFVGPFAWLRDFEVFRMIRVPARASVFLGLALAMLAGFGLDRVRRRGARWALLSLALLEAVSAPLNVVAADRCINRDEPPPRVYAWLAAQSGDAPVIELPILPNDGLFQRPKFDDSVYLLRSTAHWRPLVNGYAGTEPPGYVKVREAMKDFPSQESIGLLRALGVRYAIVHLRGLGPNRRKSMEDRLGEGIVSLREAARFGDDLVLEIVPTDPGGNARY
jgi:hypothetical protein